jgi:predicted  nucleic acid-binding Zn ribbon protein
MCRYKELDLVQLGCGPLEIAAYRELATPDSSLSKRGRELAKVVEIASKKPTFYYLMRYWGRREGEASECVQVAGIRGCKTAVTTMLAWRGSTSAATHAGSFRTKL